MYATMFRIDLHEISSFRDRGRAGRSLATTLGALRGFVAFIALEAGDGEIAGLCIVDDSASIDEVQGLTAQWQRENSAQTGSSNQPIAAGKVIVQRGF